MVATAPEIYKKYVSVNRKEELVLYVEALNALYGIMKAALLFYIKFVKNLKSNGFELNPYDPCVANKIVDGAQLTVVWHVHDLKVSHVDAGVVTRMSVWMQNTDVTWPSLIFPMTFSQQEFKTKMTLSPFNSVINWLN